MKKTKNERILAGEYRNESINFTFRVWAYRKLLKKELFAIFRVWARERDRRRTVKNKTVDVESEIGCPPVA